MKEFTFSMLNCLSTSFPLAGQVALGPEQPGMSPVCSQNASDRASNPYLKWEMYWNQINQTGTDLKSIQSIRFRKISEFQNFRIFKKFKNSKISHFKNFNLDSNFQK